MATACIAQLTVKCYPKTKTVARFDQAHASTDGGVVWLKALDARLQLTDRLAACLIAGIPTRSGTRYATCCASASLAYGWV